MEIGVGLPTNTGGASGPDVPNWAARAERLGFACLAATDRLAGETWDPIVALSAAAAVTTRCRLITNVIVVPNRASAGHLAKQLMTLDQLSEGRLVVGVGVGDRTDDYRVAGQPMEGRHQRLDVMLNQMLAVWAGADPALAGVGPRLNEHGPPILMGGRSASTFQRAARHAIGWTVAVSSPEQLSAGVAQLRHAWVEAGRSGQPRVVALTYYGLGNDSATVTPAYLRDYYAFIGPIAEVVATSAPTDAEAVDRAITAYADAGADELLFLPTIPGAEQLELLAAATAPYRMG